MMITLNLALLRLASDAQSLELYNALKKIEQLLTNIENAKVKPTNNQDGDYYISKEQL